MSKFIRVQHQSYVEYYNGKSEMTKDWQWINLDFVVSYFPPSGSLHFADGEKMNITEEGEEVLLKAFESQSANLNNKQPIKEGSNGLTSNGRRYE